MRTNIIIILAALVAVVGIVYSRRALLAGSLFMWVGVVMMGIGIILAIREFSDAWPPNDWG